MNRTRDPASMGILGTRCFPLPDHDSSSPVVKLCREFVRIPSPSGQEGALAAVVAARMRAMGFSVETDAFGNALGLRKGARSGPTLILDAHLDTVPVTHAPAWLH